MPLRPAYAERKDEIPALPYNGTGAGMGSQPTRLVNLG